MYRGQQTALFLCILIPFFSILLEFQAGTKGVRAFRLSFLLPLLMFFFSRSPFSPSYPFSSSIVLSFCLPVNAEPPC